eukprot:scaffold26413_cov138-Isochrysis_galbana.AAC.1
MPPHARPQMPPSTFAHLCTPQVTTPAHAHRMREPDTPEEEVAAKRAQMTSAAGMSYTGTDEGTRRKFEENAGHRFDVGRLQRKRTAREAQYGPGY